MKNYIEILDTTLRDGAQAKGISLSLEDKKNIYKALTSINIPLIECGNPVSNQRDKQVFDMLSERKNNLFSLVAFGSTRKKYTSCSEDRNIRAMLECKARILCIVGKSSAYQVEKVIHTDLEENLKMIYDTISILTDNGKSVYFDCEHFFDGYKDNPEYTLKTLETAKRAGANCLVLCDTNGSVLPSEVYDIVHLIKKETGAKLGVHFHNDIGCATANSLMAVRAGATHIQGTMIGLGERCGNANLSEVIPTLELKMGYETIGSHNIAKLTETAKTVAKVLDVSIADTMPYVGKNAFCHKGGMHIDGVMKEASSFEHISPEQVGNERNLLLSDISGKSVILEKVNKYVEVQSKDDPNVQIFLDALKGKEALGYQYESAEASFELLVKQIFHKYNPFFDVELYRVMGENTLNNKGNSSALVKVRVGNETEFAGDEGKGPVNALDKALRKALVVFFPELSSLRLIDYRVRVVNPSGATAATVRVIMRSTDGKKVFSTIGVSHDVIEASFHALLDAFEYKLME